MDNLKFACEKELEAKEEYDKAATLFDIDFDEFLVKHAQLGQRAINYDRESDRWARCSRSMIKVMAVHLTPEEHELASEKIHVKPWYDAVARINNHHVSTAKARWEDAVRERDAAIFQELAKQNQLLDDCPITWISDNEVVV